VKAPDLFSIDAAPTMRPREAVVLTRMTDETNETPIQRALRLKKQALDAKPKPPRGGRFQRDQAAAAQSSSKSKPWMSR
jgi:hypothetical protein